MDEVRRRQAPNVWEQREAEKKREVTNTRREDTKATDGDKGYGGLREELERMRQSSLEAIRMMEAKVKETEETVKLIMTYNRQFREENKARDRHMQGLQETVETMNDGMLEVREDVDVLTQEQKLQAIRIITIERALKKMKIMVEDEEAPTVWDDGSDLSEGEMEYDEEDESERNRGQEEPQVKKVKTEDGPKDANTKQLAMVTPPAVRYSLRGGVEK